MGCWNPSQMTYSESLRERESIENPSEAGVRVKRKTRTRTRDLLAVIPPYWVPVKHTTECSGSRTSQIWLLKVFKICRSVSETKVYHRAKYRHKQLNVPLAAKCRRRLRLTFKYRWNSEPSFNHHRLWNCVDELRNTVLNCFKVQPWVLSETRLSN